VEPDAPRPRSRTDAVRDHYARLAPEYARKANPACERAYRDLIRRWLRGAGRVLELGAGSTGLVNVLEAKTRVACDLSLPMIRATAVRTGIACFVGDAQRIPCRDGSFDAVFSINLLEHLADPPRVFAEAARVLAPRGRCLAVTPNGDLEPLLDILERLHLKLPEGPHRFLTFRALTEAAGPRFVIIEHRRFLMFPAGPRGFVQAVDGAWSGRDGRGLFQYILLEKRAI
jgi:SAM-dependent methyltransferase